MKLLFLAIFSFVSCSLFGQTFKDSVYYCNDYSSEQVFHLYKDCNKFFICTKDYTVKSALVDELVKGERSLCGECKDKHFTSKPANEKKKNNYNNSSDSKGGSVQCSGTTQKNTRCKRMTTNPSGRCYQH